MKILTHAIKDSTREPRNDGMLHFSNHLSNDRHTAIYYKHGYPSIPQQPWSGTLPLMQGTAIHNEIHRIMQATEYEYYSECAIEATHEELTLTWVGTADAYMNIDDEYWLVDYKTISGAGLGFLDGPKPEHVLQLNAYYHFGLLQPDHMGILYIPTSPDYKRQMHEPIFYGVAAMSKEDLIKRMLEVEDEVISYIENGTASLPPYPRGEIKCKQNAKTKVFDLTYRPHYANLYCPWRYEDDDPCGCSKDTFRKIGKWSKKKGVIEGDETEVLTLMAALQPEALQD